MNKAIGALGLFLLEEIPANLQHPAVVHKCGLYNRVA